METGEFIFTMGWLALMMVVLVANFIYGTEHVDRDLRAAVVLGGSVLIGLAGLFLLSMIKSFIF